MVSAGSWGTLPEHQLYVAYLLTSGSAANKNVNPRVQRHIGLPSTWMPSTIRTSIPRPASLM